MGFCPVRQFATSQQFCIVKEGAQNLLRVSVGMNTGVVVSIYNRFVSVQILDLAHHAVHPPPG